MNLTRTILASLHGHLDITVLRKGARGHNPLTVIGVAQDGSRSPWADVPEALRQDKMLYCVEGPDGSGGWDREFIFAEDVEVIDAPARLVVEALLDLIGALDGEVAQRLEYGEDCEDEELGTGVDESGRG
jgi:hypothetical protein